jgi:nicotinamidase-related amidase
MPPVEHDGTALLVMDIQEEIVARFGDDAKLLERLRTAIEAARAHGVLVIYVKVQFRPGYPEINPRNQTFSLLAESGGLSGAGARVHSAVEPQPGDVEVIKKRVSAFAGSDLQVILRSNDIRHLVLTGIATSGVVLSTLRQAADMDYELTVLSDGCADLDPEVHRVLLEKVFPRQATVTDVDAWASGLVASA